MPLYEYRCEACGSELEQLDRMGAPAPACPDCGQGMRRLLSLAVVRGSGIRPELAPEPGARSKPRKLSGEETVERVARRIQRESRKPGATRRLSYDEARAKARSIRLRRERKGD